MTTLEHLKRDLKYEAPDIEISQPAVKHPLTDEQYSAGYHIIAKSSGQNAYHDFIIPQLSLVLEKLLETRSSLSILEVGPGPKSIIGRLPGYLQRRVSTYSAFEPNVLFASELEESLRARSEVGHHPLPCLETPPDIVRASFQPRENTSSERQKEFDVALFCHSMYSMTKHKAVEHALGMLREPSSGELVVVFHRDSHPKFK